MEYFGVGQVLTGVVGSSEEGCEIVVLSSSGSTARVRVQALNEFWSHRRSAAWFQVGDHYDIHRQTMDDGSCKPWWTFESSLIPWFIFSDDGTFVHYR